MNSIKRYRKSHFTEISKNRGGIKNGDGFIPCYAIYHYNDNRGDLFHHEENNKNCEREKMGKRSEKKNLQTVWLKTKRGQGIISCPLIFYESLHYTTLSMLCQEVYEKIDFCQVAQKSV